MKVIDMIREAGKVSMVIINVRNTRHTDSIVARCPVNELSDGLLNSVARYFYVTPEFGGNVLHIVI